MSSPKPPVKLAILDDYAKYIPLRFRNNPIPSDDDSLVSSEFIGRDVCHSYQDLPRRSPVG